MYAAFMTSLEKILHRRGTTLLAISGGVDSVVLLHLFGKSGHPFEIAHAHFGLRGKEADEDEAFVQSLADKYGVAAHRRRFATRAYAAAQGLSIQMAARALRYTWFQELLASPHLAQVATAHHENDSLETFLRNFAKGSGLAGLLGIPRKQGHLIRPLLRSTKAEILAYAQAQGLVWREDASNAQSVYERNFIRHEVVPPLKQLNAGLEKTFARTRMRLTGTYALFQEQARILQKELWHETKGGIDLAVEKIWGKSYAATLLHHWLKEFGFRFEPLYRWTLQKPQKGKRLESATHTLIVASEKWRLVSRAKAPNLPRYELLEQVDSSLPLPHGQLRFSFVDKDKISLFQKPWVGLLDAALLEFPLVLRPWKMGDRFHPLGMGHTQKVSDFLTNAKVFHHERKASYVLVSGKEIAWLVGHRVDERFKVGKHTERVAVFHFEKS